MYKHFFGVIFCHYGHIFSKMSDNNVDEMELSELIPPLLSSNDPPGKTVASSSRMHQKLGNMPLDTHVQAEMFQAAIFLPSNNAFMRLIFFRMLYMCAVGFILSDFVSDWYVAGIVFNFMMQFMLYVF